MVVVAAPNTRTMSDIRETILFHQLQEWGGLPSSPIPSVNPHSAFSKRANRRFDAPVTSATGWSGGALAFVLALLDELGVSY